MFSDNDLPSEDDITNAKSILTEIMASKDPRRYRLDFKKKAHFIFSKQLRYSRESDVQNILKAIESLAEKTDTSVEMMRMNSVIEGAKQAFKDFERWGCQIARYTDPKDMEQLALRYTEEREIQLKEEMWFGEQSFRDAENALKLCTNPAIQPSKDGPLSFLANTVTNNQYGLRIAFEYLMECHYQNAMARGTLVDDANMMKMGRTDEKMIYTQLSGSYEWAQPLADEMYKLANQIRIPDLAAAVTFDGYILNYEGRPISYFDYAYKDNGSCCLHGRQRLGDHWPRLESLFHTVIHFPLDLTQKKSVTEFYDKLSELIWLIGQTTPAVRGSGKLAEQCVTMVHLKHNLRTPLLKFDNPQLDVLDITLPLSIYKKRFFNFFELDTLPRAVVTHEQKSNLVSIHTNRQIEKKK